MDVQKLDGGTGVDTVDYSGVDRDGSAAAAGGVTIALDDRGNFGTESVTVDLNGTTSGVGDGGVDVTIVEASGDPLANPDPLTQVDILVGIENLYGSADADILHGNNSPNVLRGGGAPSGSLDYLLGGGGADTFLFDKDDDGNVVILDFSKNDGDMIDLESFGLTATDLATLLESDGGSGTTLTYTLDLSAHDGGMITVMMDERFAELDAGDFII